MTPHLMRFSLDLFDAAYLSAFSLQDSFAAGLKGYSSSSCSKDSRMAIFYIIKSFQKGH